MERPGCRRLAHSPPRLSKLGKDLKSTRSRRARRIQLDPSVGGVLERAHRSQQPRALWVCSTRHGEPWAPETIRANLYKLAAAAGVKHLNPLAIFRHAATWQMIRDRVPIPMIAASLGHHNPAFTLRI